MTRILFRRWLGLLLAAVCLASTSFSARQDKARLSASDEAALRALVEQFFAAQEKNVATQMKLWSKRSPQQGEFKQSQERQQAGAQTGRYAKPDILRTRVVGEGLELRTSVEYTSTEARAETERLVRDIVVVKEGRKWKVWKYEAPGKKLTAALAKVEGEAERAALLAEGRELETPELVQEMNSQGRALSNQGKHDRALAVLQAAQDIAERIGSRREIYRTFRNIGNTYYSQGKYAQALEYYQKILALTVELGDWAGRATTQGSIGNIYYLQGKYAQALEYYQKSLAWAGELGDKAGRAAALSNIGNIYYSQGNYAQALWCYQEGLELAVLLRDKTGRAAALNNIGNIYRSQGNYAQALDYYQKSLALRKELGDKAGQADALSNIGIIYSSQGNYAQALEHYWKSLDLAEELGDKARRANALNNIGIVYSSQGNYAQAREHHQNSLALAVELGDKAGRAAALGNIGNSYYLQGNYAQALEHHQNSFALREDLGDKAGRAATLNNIGIIYSSQGDYARALGHHQNSLALSVELGDKAGRAAALSNIGGVYYALGNIGRVDNPQDNYAQALEHYQESLALRKELGDQAGHAAALGNIGSVYLSQGNYAQALEYYQNSLKLSVELGDQARRATALNNIGIVYFLQGNYARALEYARSSVALADQIGARETLWQAQRAAGRAHRALAQPDLARKAFSDAIDTIESLRTQTAGGKQERQRSFERQVDPYRELSDLLATGGNTAQALETIERAKARVLLDVLQADRVSVTKAMLPAERLWFGPLAAAVAPKAMSPAETDHKVQRGEAPPLTVQDFGQLLPDSQTALLEFVVSEQQVSLFVLARGSRSAEVEIKRYPLAIKPKELAADAAKFSKMMEDKNLEFAQPAGKLYQHLLQPAAAQLRGKRTLVIVPDGPLWKLPFQALMTSANRYLLQDHVIFYAPSLSALCEMSRRRPTSQAAPTMLAFGNPSLGVPGKRRSSVLVGERLESLPDAEQLVKKLERLYGVERSKVYIGADASEERFKSEAKNYSILQLATHGILNDSAPMYSHLVLAQGVDGSKEDGVLEAREIVEMDLKADLAVLSACRTALGGVSAGEGMIGLTWALFAAGVPRTVVSQWEVESGSTSELMVEFHRQFLAQGAKGGVAESLRKAALNLLSGKDYYHPSHWAGFIVIGDGF